MFNYAFNAGTVLRQYSLSAQAVPPPLVAGKYRSAGPSLFADVQAGTPMAVGSSTYNVTPARLSVTAPTQDFAWGQFGANASYVDAFSGWAWTNVGGDWINNVGTSQGTTNPHFTFTANSVSSGSAVYNVNMVTACNAAFTRGKWNAFIVKSTGGTRAFASQNNTLSLPAPVINVTYADTSTATLQCISCSPMISGTAYAQVGMSEASTAWTVALEFQMPTQTVTAATMVVTLTQHTGTASTINGYLANPTISSTIVPGLASSYNKDTGLQGETSILVNHRMQDGSVLSDWLIPYSTLNVNVFNTSSWSPDLFGLGAADNTKLPTAAGGVSVSGSKKWFHKSDQTSNISFVQSSYSGDNFVPLATGLGAMRINLPGKPSDADGSSQGYVGGSGSDLWLLFDKAVSGLLDEVYVRFYMRIGSQSGDLNTIKMFRNAPGSTAYFAYQGGKWGMGAHHWTQFGGNNQVGGGNLGWTNRLAFTQVPINNPVAGFQSGVHAYDMIGTNFLMGNQGGVGASFYPDKWYCIEIRCKLNTWTGSSGSPHDGVMETWVDGMLASHDINWTYRDGPLDYRVTPPKQYGTASGGKTNAAGYSTGATVITLAASGSGNYVLNDTINFPGDFTNYQITSGATGIGSGGSITITPGLQIAIPSSQTNIGYASVGMPAFRNLGAIGLLLNHYNGGVLPADRDMVMFYSLMACGTSYIGPADLT